MTLYTLYIMVTADRRRTKIGYTSRTAKVRAYELFRLFGIRYKVIDTVQFHGNRVRARHIEAAVQDYYQDLQGIVWDSKTDDHFFTDGRFTEKTIAQRFRQAIAQASKGQAWELVE